MGEYSEDILNNLGREILLDGKKIQKRSSFPLHTRKSTLSHLKTQFMFVSESNGNIVKELGFGHDIVFTDNCNTEASNSCDFPTSYSCPK